MDTAYINLNICTEKSNEIIKDLFIPKVKEVSETWGIQDIFVKIQTESMDELNDICKDIIHMNGIEPTVILESVNEYTWGIQDIFVKIQTESMDELNDICKDIIHMNGIEPTVILESVNEYMTFIMR